MKKIRVFEQGGIPKRKGCVRGNGQPNCLQCKRFGRRAHGYGTYGLGDFLRVYPRKLWWVFTKQQKEDPESKPTLPHFHFHASASAYSTAILTMQCSSQYIPKSPIIISVIAAGAYTLVFFCFESEEQKMKTSPCKSPKKSY